MPSGDVEMMTTERPRWLRSIVGEFSRDSALAKPFSELALVRSGAPHLKYLRWLAGYQSLVFPGLWLLIGFISAIDTYLTVKFRESLVFHELNPIANLLLDLDAGDASLLIGLKFLGSIIALGILAALYLQNRRIGLMVSYGLASFQVGLLWYLIAV
jgi:hypothetical protein